MIDLRPGDCLDRIAGRFLQVKAILSKGNRWT